MNRATFICGGEFVPASRFRVHPIEAALRVEGWQTRLLHGYGALDQHLATPLARRAYRAGCRVLRAARTGLLQTDGPIMVQRLAWPWWSGPEVSLARRNPLVFDFDDAVFLGEGGRPSRCRRRALRDVFEASAHVVAGNSWLAEAVDALVPVTVVPTCIDTSRYVPGPRDGRGPQPVIGWMGTSSNFRHLHQLVGPVRELRRAGLRFEFRLCSDTEPTALCSELGATFTKWSDTVEIPFLQSLDIGLMPLEHSDWCRGKCSFKLIQYMAVGCPVVATGVGMNRDVVADGRTGYLVDDDWVEALMDLLRNRDRAVQMGKAARQRATEHFDISRAVATYRRLLADLQ